MSRDESRPRRRARPIDPARLPPGPLRDLKDTLYELYTLMEQPTLDQLAEDVTRVADELDLPGVPKRDTIARIIGSPTVPANGADLAAVASVLAHGAGRDVSTVVAQVRQLWVRAQTVSPPPGAVRVREARPRLLGVHACIQVDPAADDLPPYVPRDLDAHLRAAIGMAANRGGFVLLVGGSSVGKTRTLFEAIRAVPALADRWLMQPAGAPHATEFATSPAGHAVVWLDELQRYLAKPAVLTSEVVRALIEGGNLIVATLWPQEYASRAALRVPGQSDPHADARELLKLAHVIDVPAVFSEEEHRRAEAIATDLRIRAALDTPDAGFTQVLAAGPGTGALVGPRHEPVWQGHHHDGHGCPPARRHDAGKP